MLVSLPPQAKQTNRQVEGSYGSVHVARQETRRIQQVDIDILQTPQNGKRQFCGICLSVLASPLLGYGDPPSGRVGALEDGTTLEPVGLKALCDLQIGINCSSIGCLLGALRHRCPRLSEGFRV
jgi:hypothetical protein